jgi:hypothetical protein
VRHTQYCHAYSFSNEIADKFPFVTFKRFSKQVFLALLLTLVAILPIGPAVLEIYVITKIEYCLAFLLPLRPPFLCVSKVFPVVDQLAFTGKVEKFFSVVLSDISRPRSGNEVESKDPEGVSSTMPQQGILPMICLVFVLYHQQQLIVQNV